MDISVFSAVAFHDTCFYHQKHAIDSQESKEIVARTLSVFLPNPETGTLCLPSFSSVQTYEGTPPPGKLFREAASAESVWK